MLRTEHKYYWPTFGVVAAAADDGDGGGGSDSGGAPVPARANRCPVGTARAVMNSKHC